MSQVLRGESKARDGSYCLSLTATWSRSLHREGVVHKQVFFKITLHEHISSILISGGRRTSELPAGVQRLRARHIAIPQLKANLLFLLLLLLLQQSASLMANLLLWKLHQSRWSIISHDQGIYFFVCWFFILKYVSSTTLKIDPGGWRGCKQSPCGSSRWKTSG